MKKSLIGLLAIMALTVTGCGTPAPSSEEPSSEIPSSSEEPSSETPSSELPSSSEAVYNINLDLAQTGLGSATVSQVDGATHKLVINTIDGVNASATMDGNALTITNGEATFEATNGATHNIVVTLEVNELTAEFAVAYLEDYIENRTSTSYSYEFRTYLYDTYENKVSADMYRRYDVDLYTNGMESDLIIGRGTSHGYFDETYTYEISSQGRFASYKVNDGYYMRGYEPTTPAEEGFMQILERNRFYDETSEDLGYMGFLEQMHANFSGTSKWSEQGHYSPAKFSTTIGDESVEMHIGASKDFDGSQNSAEDNYFTLELDTETYEVVTLRCHEQVFISNKDSEPSSLTDVVYSNFEGSELVEGEIEELDPTNMLGLVSTSIPTIQDNIADGTLNNADAVKILDNIWAYAENTRRTTASGDAVVYDENWNPIPGFRVQEIVAYADDILITTDTITPNNTALDTIVIETQKVANDNGIFTTVARNGKVSPSDSYQTMFNVEYVMKKQFSASPLIHDFMIGTAIKEAIQYGLEDTTTPYSVFDFTVVSAIKEGNDITIEWNCFSHYGNPSSGSKYNYKVVIEDNFITQLAFGAGEIGTFHVTYYCEQGEYTDFTGTLFEFPN